jgi:nitronate monooxygenase
MGPINYREKSMALPPVLQNLSLPVIASPMFIASGPALVAAQCKAGIVGSFPALNARPAELLDTWLTDLQRELADYQAAIRTRRSGRSPSTRSCTSRTTAWRTTSRSA